MNTKPKILSLLAAFTLSPLAILSANAQTQLSEQSKVFINGVGPVRVGMTVAEASKAAGVQLVSQGSFGVGSTCAYFKPKGKSSVAFMVTNGRVARIDIAGGSQITTRSGAQIGDTEARIKSLYPGQIKVTPHKYTSGNYLTFVPKDRQDSKYRVVFETDGERVTEFRAGKLPEVEFVEGCA